MKLYSKDGVELHQHTNKSGTRYKLYVKDAYYPFVKLPTTPNSKSEFSNSGGREYVKEHDPMIPRVKYTCMKCGHTSMQAASLTLMGGIVICTDCKGEMLPPVKKKREVVSKRAIKRKGMERF